MQKLTVTTQKPADKMWIDEEGILIPYNRTTPYERKSESTLSKLAKEAIVLNEKLAAYKADLRKKVEALYNDFVEMNDGKIQGKGKGNITLYNFDRSVKVELNINEPIHFDEEYIKLAQAELNSFLKDTLRDVADWIEPMILSAFEKSRGELDTDKVLSLKKHASRITDPRYHQAMKFIDQAINRPKSKEYYRVWVRDTDSQYKNVQLNFSNI
jgi:hypothetical protein